MTSLTEACGELATWLPEAEARITTPDTDGTTGRGQPSSKPPWNSQTAMVLFDALEGVRQLEQAWLQDLSPGRQVARQPMAATGSTLASIVRLAHAVDGDTQHQAAAAITAWVTAILALPSIGRAEPWRKVPGRDCPYCGPKGFGGSLRAKPIAGVVACLRGAGVCVDANGNPPVGRMSRSKLDGAPVIEWADGLVT